MIKRSLFAISMMAALSSVAYAQSSIDIYGRLNISYESQHVGNSHYNSMVDNASRIGFRGQEQLSNDLKAFFVLENGFDATTGRMPSGYAFSRESFIGLGSKAFGQIRAGRIMSSVYYASADYVSMHNHDTGTSSDMLFGYQATGDYGNNTVAYMTPSFYGTTVEASYSMAESTPNSATRNPDALNVALNYDYNKLHLGAGYAKSGGAPVDVFVPENVANPGVSTMYVFRALYTFFDAFTVGGYYERDSFIQGTRNNYRLALKYVYGNSEFHLNGGYATNMSHVSDSGAQQYTVGYNYNLSLRTKVYAFYTRLLNDQNAQYGVVDHPGDDFSSIAVGLRHNF